MLKYPKLYSIWFVSKTFLDSIKLYQLWLLFFVLAILTVWLIDHAMSIRPTYGPENNSETQYLFFLKSWLSATAALAVEGVILARVLSLSRGTPVRAFPFLILFAVIGLCGLNLFSFYLIIGNLLLGIIPIFTLWLLYKSVFRPASRLE